MNLAVEALMPVADSDHCHGHCRLVSGGQDGGQPPLGQEHDRRILSATVRANRHLLAGHTAAQVPFPPTPTPAIINGSAALHWEDNSLRGSPCKLHIVQMHPWAEPEFVPEQLATTH